MPVTLQKQKQKVNDMAEQLIRAITDRYDSYLSDESSRKGFADSIAFPETEEELISIIRSLDGENVAEVTIQGARTGIRGTAVPSGGCIINLSKMDHIIASGKNEDGSAFITAEPGVTLDTITAEAARRFRGENLFWPPSPSEGSATIGGIAASGAFGMNIAGYGDTYKYISELRYVDTEGNINVVSGEASVKKCLGDLAEGYCLTSLSLSLRKQPESVWGTTFFFRDRNEALACADELQQVLCMDSGGDARITVLEYLDGEAVRLAEENRTTLPAIQAVPEIDEGIQSVIYVEVEGDDDECGEAMMELAFIMADHGADPDEAWTLVGQNETARFHEYRHAVTEAAAQYMAAKHAEDPSMYLLAEDIRMEGAPFSTLAEVYVNNNSETGYRLIMCGSIMVPVVRLLAVADNIEGLRQASNNIWNCPNDSI